MVGWHHQLNGPEFEHAPGDSKGQGRLACCSPWGCRESDTNSTSILLWVIKARVKRNSGDFQYTQAERMVPCS